MVEPVYWPLDGDGVGERRPGLWLRGIRVPWMRPLLCRPVGAGPPTYIQKTENFEQGGYLSASANPPLKVNIPPTFNRNLIYIGIIKLPHLMFFRGTKGHRNIAPNLIKLQQITTTKTKVSAQAAQNHEDTV